MGDVFEPYNGGVVRRRSMRVWDTLARAGTRSRSRRLEMRLLVAGFAAAQSARGRSASQSVCASRRSVHWAVEKGSMPAGDGSSAGRASRCPRLGDRAARAIESASRAKSVSAVHGGAPRRAADPFRYSTRRHRRCRRGRTSLSSNERTPLDRNARPCRPQASRWQFCRPLAELPGGR